MIIDTDKIDKLLKSDVSGGKIAELSDGAVSPKQVSRMRRGETELADVKVATAIALQETAELVDKMPKKMPILKGIRNAVTAFNGQQGAARVYLDTSDMSVETTVYGGPAEWARWHDDNHVELLQKATTRMDERDDQITMLDVQLAAIEVINGDQQG